MERQEAMIGVFDSGQGGLTVLAALAARFSDVDFLYFGDHANAPYGNRTSRDIVGLTRHGVEVLFERGCGLVLLACNTATAIACRQLQQDWLATSRWSAHNVLGIVAPTVEAATQTPWAVATPQYPQKYNTDRIAVFGTVRTIESGVYGEEIRKRCPRARVVQQACPDLVAAIETRSAESALDALVAFYVSELLCVEQEAPDAAILGCTHYPLVRHLFARHLPAATRILSQPGIVADSLEDYLSRHPRFRAGRAQNGQGGVRLLTSGRAELPGELAGNGWSYEALA